MTLHTNVTEKGSYTLTRDILFLFSNSVLFIRAVEQRFQQANIAKQKLKKDRM